MNKDNKIQISKSGRNCMSEFTIGNNFAAMAKTHTVARQDMLSWLKLQF